MSKWAGINYLDSAPAVGQQPQAGTALTLEIPAHEARHLQAGKVAIVAMQIVPITVVDFYRNPGAPSASATGALHRKN